MARPCAPEPTHGPWSAAIVSETGRWKSCYSSPGQDESAGLCRATQDVYPDEDLVREISERKLCLAQASAPGLSRRRWFKSRTVEMFTPPGEGSCLVLGCSVQRPP